MFRVAQFYVKMFIINDWVSKQAFCELILLKELYFDDSVFEISIYWKSKWKRIRDTKR